MISPSNVPPFLPGLAPLWPFYRGVQHLPRLRRHHTGPQQPKGTGDCEEFPRRLQITDRCGCVGGGRVSLSLTSGLPLCSFPSSCSAESTGSKSGFEVGAGSAGKPGSSLGRPHRFYFPLPPPPLTAQRRRKGRPPADANIIPSKVPRFLGPITSRNASQGSSSPESRQGAARARGVRARGRG